MTRSSRTQHAVRLLTSLLLLTIASACRGDDPVRPPLPAFDVLGVWDVRDSAQLEYDVPGGARRVLTEFRHGEVTVAPSARPNEYFIVLGTIADSVCDSAACIANRPGFAIGLAVADRRAGLLGFSIADAREIPASALSDSGIHWVETVDVDPMPLGACGFLALVFDVPEGASRCRVATHWRRRAAPR